MNEVLIAAARVVNNWGARPPAHACLSPAGDSHCHACQAWEDLLVAVRRAEAEQPQSKE